MTRRRPDGLANVEALLTTIRDLLLAWDERLAAPTVSLPESDDGEDAENIYKAAAEIVDAVADLPQTDVAEHVTKLARHIQTLCAQIIVRTDQ